MIFDKCTTFLRMGHICHTYHNNTWVEVHNFIMQIFHQHHCDTTCVADFASRNISADTANWWQGLSMFSVHWMYAVVVSAFKLWRTSVWILRNMEKSLSTWALLCGRDNRGDIFFANSGKRMTCSGVFIKKISDQTWSICRTCPSSSSTMAQ